MKYSLKNFRVFNQDGVTLDMRPITILTGCNSSGKSSIVKSMVLLDSFFNSLRRDADMGLPLKLSEYKLDFSSRPNNMLGNFSRVVNRDSELFEISYEYTVHSHMIGEDIKVCLVFSKDENDELQDGYLKEISFLKEDDQLIYKSCRDKGEEGDLNLLVPNFLRYAYGDYLVELARNIEADDCIGEMNADERKEFENDFNAFKEQFKSDYGRDAIKDIIWCWNNDNNHRCLIRKFIPENPSLLDKCSNSNSLFYIPLIEDLATLSIEDAVEKMKNIVKGDTQEQVLNAIIDRIGIDYVNSGSNTFSEYFNQKEQEFLKLKYESDNFMRLFVSANDSISSPCLFNKKFLGLQQQNLMHFAPVIGPFDKDSLEYTPTTEEEQLAEMTKKTDQIKYCNISFDMLYEVLMYLNAERCGQKDSSCWRYTNDMGFERYNHHMLSMFKEYIEKALEEILVYEFSKQISYVSSSIVEIKRLYTLDSNDEFTSLIKRYLEAKRKFQNKDERNKINFIPGNFINKWVKEFEVGHSISIKVDEEGLGLTLRLHKDENDTKGTCLSEQGYGITQLFALLLRVETAILEAKSVMVADDSYYMGTLWMSDYTYICAPSIIAIEEPEVHLHPKFQSKLADLFVEANSKYNIGFIVETHSEYLLRKLQTMVAKSLISTSNVAVVYVNHPDISRRPIYTPQVKQISIKEDGMLSDAFGSGFFDEADRLAMDLLSIKVDKNENA